ncbi:hypothetical protein [Rickettsiella endosymbiont of Aleochara curtula]|uniref:hypothetical protein n=1 Tax=Rickettsiella endosymbiont of Aleochara curtula TaxID=3077936 RepID=UPI00313C2BDA
MPNFLEQKNILIVPLSAFIVFNKGIAGEKFANLSGKFFDEMFSCDEEIKEHEEFSKKITEKILSSKLVADFNLGKKTKQEFILELLRFLKLPSEKAAEAKVAWNALLNFDKKLTSVFEALLNLTQQGTSIYFIGNTNELHAEKILDLFALNAISTLSFSDKLSGPALALPLAISQSSSSGLNCPGSASQCGTVYFCLSYAYKTLLEQPRGLLTKLFTTKPTPGLLAHLKVYLNDISKTKKDDILLVNPYEKNNTITKKLALETISKEKFYTDLLAFPVDTAVTTMQALKLVEVHSMPTNLSADDNMSALQAAGSAGRSTHLSSPTAH